MFNNPITQFIEKLNNSDKLALLRLSLLVLASGFIEVLGIASIAPLIGLLSDSEYISANPYLLNIFNIIGYIPNNMTLFIGFFVIVFFVLSNLLIAYTLWKSVYFSAIQHHKIANRLMEHYLHKKYIDHINSNSSEASKDILHEAGVVSDQIILPILQVFSKSIIIIFISIFLAVINYQVFIISILSLMIIYSIIYFTIKRRMTAYGLQKITANQERYKVINDTFKSIKEIKFNYSENFFLKNFNKPQKDFSILTAKNTHEWIDIFTPRKIPCGPINNIKEAVENEQIKARNMIVKAHHKIIGDFKLAGNPIKMSSYKDVDTRGEIPDLDQHREKILKEFT